MRPLRWLPVVGVSVLAAGFAWLNRWETVRVHLGIARFERAPLSMVFFAAFLFGMVSMLLLGLRQDLRLRRLLRERGLLDEPVRPTAPVRLAARELEPVPEPYEDRTAGY